MVSAILTGKSGNATSIFTFSQWFGQKDNFTGICGKSMI